MRRPPEHDDYDYNLVINSITKNEKPFRIQTFGSRRNIYIGDSCAATNVKLSNLDLGNVTSLQLSRFLAMFNRGLYNQFKKNTDLYNIKILHPMEPTIGKNHKLWDKMPINNRFYYLDIKSAYWQVGHELGYISKNVFEKYMNLDDYKESKRYCFSFLARENSMVYINKGKENIEIKCDIEILRNVYHNVKNRMYQIIYEIKKQCPYWIEYNQDSITVKGEDWLKAQMYFKEIGIQTKGAICKKIDDNSYKRGTIVRKFIKHT